MSRFLKIVCTLFIVMLTTGNSYCQNATAIDSLHKAISYHSDNDTNKVLLLAKLAHQFYYTNADSEILYAKQAYLLADKLKFSHGKIVALEAMGSAKFQAGMYDSAIAFYNKGLDICYKTTDHREGCILLNNIANALYRLSKYNDALEYYDSAIICAKKINNLEIAGKALSNIGNIFYTMGNYSHALKNYLEGLKIQERLGNTAATASDLSNIANVYFRLFQYDKAIEYNTRGMELNKKSGAKLSLIANLTTFAMIYDAEKKYDSSLLRLNEALALVKETKDAFTENIINSNIAECYLKKGDYAKAYPIYMQCIAMSEKLGDAEGTAITKTGAGQALVKQGKNAEGIKYLQEGLALIQQLGLKEQALIVTSSLADAYENAGNYKQSLHFIKLNQSYRDSINRSKSRQEAEQLVFNYELQKKEEVITLMKKNEDIQLSKDKIKSLLLFSFVVGFMIVAIVAFLFLRNVRTLQKSRELLRRQNEEMEVQAKKLKELNDFKDNTFNVLSHDLRSPVNALTSAMMLLDEKLITPEEFAMHRHELNSKLQSVSLLLENMLYWARNQMKGEDILNVTKLNIKRKTLRVIAVLKDAALQKDINLTCEIPDNIHASGDANQVDIILRNLVSNAIKFTPAQGSIVISAIESNNKTHISVADTGVGMTKEQIDRLFKENSHTSTDGTSGEKGTGLGLQLCYKFAKNNNGDIVASSERGKGTTFTLILPA